MEFRAASSATKQNTDLVNYNFMSYSNKMTITEILYKRERAYDNEI